MTTSWTGSSNDCARSSAPELTRCSGELLLAARSVYGESDSGRRSLVVDEGGRIAQALQSGPVRLDRFALIEQVGAGTFGAVFRARDTEIDRIVAIKVQRALDDDEENRRFAREARRRRRIISNATPNGPRVRSLHPAYCARCGRDLPPSGQAQPLGTTSPAS